MIMPRRLNTVAAYNSRNKVKKIVGNISCLCIITSVYIGVQGAIAGTLNAGSAKTNITPDVKASQIPLGGYAARRGKPAAGVHDPVYARALVLSQGAEKIAIVSVDLCFVPVCIRDNILKKLQSPDCRRVAASGGYLLPHA